MRWDRTWRHEPPRPRALPAAPYGLRVPGLQPVSGAHGAGTGPAAWATWACATRKAPGWRARAGRGRPVASGAHAPGAAVRRRETAGRDRPRHRQEPELLFADEPTSALDAENGQRVVDILHRFARNHGATVLCVSHDPRLVRHADRVVGMEDGAIRSDRRIATDSQEQKHEAFVGRALARAPHRGGPDAERVFRAQRSQGDGGTAAGAGRPAAAVARGRSKSTAGWWRWRRRWPARWPA